MKTSLETLSNVFSQVPDPRNPNTPIPLSGVLALLFLGLLARLPYFTHIERWATHHWRQLKKPLGFKGKKPPVATTFSRILARISLNDMQNAIAEFLSQIIDNKEPLTVAVDGKTAKQMFDNSENPLQMLNVFVQEQKITLTEWSVSGDKTNEPACLKQHLDELLRQFPQLQILTGDAIYAQRPLLEVIIEHQRDYIFQVKENQPKVLDVIKMNFDDIDKREPEAVTYSKRYSKKKAS